MSGSAQPNMHELDSYQLGQVLLNAAHAARKPSGQLGLGGPAAVVVRSVIAQRAYIILAPKLIDVSNTNCGKIGP